MNQGIDALVNHLGTLFERRREKRQATIVGVERSEQSGRQGYVLAEIQRAENDSYVQKIFVGDASNFAVGDVKWVRGSGNPVDPDWQFGESIKSRNPVTGADVDAPVTVLTIPTEENPDDGFSNPVGVVTEEDQDSTVGAGVEQAQARIYYRTIIPGTYSVYDPSTFITGVSLHYRRVIDENWRYTPSHAVWPPQPTRLRLTPGIDANDLTAGVADDDGVGGDTWPVGHFVYWQIDGEILLAKLAMNGTLTILERGVEGSTAVSHANNAVVLLLSGMAVLANLDPGANHEVRIAAVTGQGLVGPPSVAVAFVTWARSSVPALTTDQFDVEMRSNGYHLEWERPEVSPGVPMTARLRYRLYRNTSATTVGAKIVDEGHMGFAADIAATLWDVPATQATASWFGIEPYDSFGNTGTVLWKQDDEPPPAPPFESWDLTPLDLAVRIAYHAERDTLSVTLDPGFSHFALYQATATNGTGESVYPVARFAPGQVDYAPPLNRAYYFQVASVDFAGNISPRTHDDTHWKIGLPNFLVTPGVRNGNFETPGPTRTVTDGAISASGTTLTSATAGFADADYGTRVTIAGAGPGGGTYYGQITAVTNATTVTVNPAAVGTVSGASTVIGAMPDKWRLGSGHPYQPNFTSGLQIAYEAAGGLNGARVMHITVPAGTYSDAGITLAQATVHHYNHLNVGMTVGAWIKAGAGLSGMIQVRNTNALFADDFGLVPDGYVLTYSTASTTTDVDSVTIGTGDWQQLEFANDDEEMFGSLTSAVAFRFGLRIVLTGVVGSTQHIYLDDISTLIY